MSILKLIVSAAILSLLVSCAQQYPHRMDMTVAIEKAKTKADHEALAVHYEQMAREMKAMSEEHKKRLAEYQALLPKDDEAYNEFIPHCLTLIKIYTQAEHENLELAHLHHLIASKFPN